MEEGNASSYVKITSNSQGTHTAFAMGRDGMMYYVFRNAAGSGPGDLYKFNPATVSSGGLNGISSAASSSPAAQIAVGFSRTNGFFYFIGNEIAGEDVTSPLSGTTPFGYTLNNQGSSTVTSTIYLCPGSPLLLSALNVGMNPPGIGVSLQPLDEDDISHELVADGPAIDYDWRNYENDVNLLDLPGYEFLEYYSGYFDLTLSISGPCGGSIQVTYRYKLIQAEILCGFVMSPPANCTAEPRNTNYSITPIGVQSAPPPCSGSWLGATSAAIRAQGFGPLINGADIAQINSHTVDVYEANPSTGATVGSTLGTFSNSGPIPGVINLNFVTANYFKTNYSTIADYRKLYVVKVAFDLAPCNTPIEILSYFRILEGDVNWKPEPQSTDDRNGAVEQMMGAATDTKLYPNPVHSNLHISWYSSSTETVKISITDMLGRVVLAKEMPSLKGENAALVNAGQWTPGVYHYKLQTANGNYTGKLVKE